MSPKIRPEMLCSFEGANEKGFTARGETGSGGGQEIGKLPWSLKCACLNLPYGIGKFGLPCASGFIKFAVEKFMSSIIIRATGSLYHIILGVILSRKEWVLAER